tara:strand:- start:26471 stop:26680 length:210 start_codon:yes stop_codon:yes gene_type:complete
MKKGLIKELKSLSPEEKLSATELLWNSLKHSDVPLSEDQLNIIREREELYHSNDQKYHSWEEVKKSINH